MRLTHVRLLVDDVARSANFYREVLGFQQQVDAGVYIELRAGDVLLGIYGSKDMAHVLGAASRPVRSNDGDRTILCLQVESVDEAHKELSHKGITFVTAPHDQEAWVIRVAHFRDPDGNLIEISAPL